MTEEEVKVGLIINPIAGMGGSVGLKGTDGAEILQEALRRGAVPLATQRSKRALQALHRSGVRFSLHVAPGCMGADLAAKMKLPAQTACNVTDEATSSSDTQAAAQALRAQGVRMILFAGGDGTARDLLSAIGDTVPVIGIPCGVKMHSGVFATGSEAAGALAAEFARRRNPQSHVEPAEVMDIDEAAYRNGELAAKLYGYLSCPKGGSRLQGPKARGGLDSELALHAAAAEIADEMPSHQVYLIGPGTSANLVNAALGLEGSLLGIDAVLNRSMAGRDLSADGILSIAGDREIGIVLGVIGGQGYILGRGNQQLTPEIIRRAGRDNLIILASEDKLARLRGGKLLVDTGQHALDLALEGFARVRTGAGRQMMMRISCGS